MPSRLDESGRAPLGRRCYGAAWRVRPAVPSLATHPHVKKHITLLGVYWVGGFCRPAFPPQVPLASDVGCACQRIFLADFDSLAGFADTEATRLG